jgi:hypothetical protein
MEQGMTPTLEDYQAVYLDMCAANMHGFLATPEDFERFFDSFGKIDEGMPATLREMLHNQVVHRVTIAQIRKRGQERRALVNKFMMGASVGMAVGWLVLILARAYLVH